MGWLAELAAPLRAAYEAGPTGFGLMRAASAVGIEVQVVAPSKTPRAPGDRVKLGGDWRRFSSPRKLSIWLGLTPSLAHSGESESQGSITKTGSGIGRRLLVESAHHYAREPWIGVTLANRQAGQPDHVLQIAWRAQTRLHRVGKRLRERGKPGNVATVAVARELAGFLWAAATVPGQRPPARAVLLWAALTGYARS